MPADDLRLERALHDAAPVVDTAGVLDQVARKRTRRRRTHRLGAVAAVLAVLLVIGATAVLVARHDGSSPHVAVPPAGISARVVSGDRAVDATIGRVRAPRPVMLDAPTGTLRAPLYVGTATVSAASDDLDANGVPRSRVVRVDGSQVVDISDFKAQVISITEGEGARWALTRNPRATEGTLPDTFLKRIGPVGDPVSHQLPIDADPVGPIAAVGGAVWVPVRDGVVQFDAADGHLVRHLALPAAAHRWVALSGKGAYVTDGGALRRLDPALGLADRIDLGPEIIGLAARGFDARVLLRNEQGGTDRARVAAAFEADPVHVGTTLPAGFHADGLESSATQDVGHRHRRRCTRDRAARRRRRARHRRVRQRATGDVGLVRAAHRHRGRERQVVRASRALGNHRRPANVDLTSDTQRRPRGDASCGSRR